MNASLVSSSSEFASLENVKIGNWKRNMKESKNLSLKVPNDATGALANVSLLLSIMD